ncbi:metallophosphoesterase [Roseicyclus mahoneyensis]|uniref:Calcineurin-like phosphoesterase family protein n=1 Tax=Roseicyclus mahoneyensis TaxID=164332 RepID=A0A316GAS5_9RHOB|nr:metallophosphoesterase [Roseicyclus mahoneyensis]PWK58004.1 calcineurin-like phosphoesterase family protein [Roseicyclus mahoneyensis]
MPRILVLGDLHADTWGRLGTRVLEETGLGPWILDNAPDLLIIAGDIANHPMWNWPMALRDIVDYVPPENVVIIPGNHDYYRFSFDGDDELRRIARRAGMRFAQKEEIRIGKVRIFCCTLWTDFALNGTPELDARAARQGLNDYHQITTSRSLGTIAGHNRQILPEDVIRVHLDHRAWLEDQLCSPHFAGAEGVTLVVTHHGPSRATAAGAIDSLTAAFHSDLDDLILETQPDYWLFGHSHRRCQATVGKTDVRCVSIGYPSEWTRGSFDEVTMLAQVLR